MKKKSILAAVLIPIISATLLALNPLKADISSEINYNNEQTTLASQLVQNYQANNDNFWNDSNFPNHYPVERELNYFLWYGLIPFTQRLAQNFADVQGNKFGTASAFLSSVLSGISSVGTSSPSQMSDDDIKAKKMTNFTLSKSPYTISQKKDPINSNLNWDFGPALDGSTTANPTPNDDTSWVVSCQVVLDGGVANCFSVPGLDNVITNGTNITLDANQTAAVMNAITYNEYHLAIYFLHSLGTVLQSKSNGTAAGNNMFSYWGNVINDALSSDASIAIFNPYVKATKDDPKPSLYASPFLQDFVNGIVKRSNNTNNTYQLSWWKDTTDSDPTKKQSMDIIYNSTTVEPLITDTFGSDSARYQINVNQLPVVSPFNGEFMPGIISYSLNPTPKTGTPSPITYSNPFNFLYQSAYLGMALYGGMLPQWAAKDNASYSGDGGDFTVIDKIMDIYYKQNFVDTKGSGTTLYQQFLNAPAPSNYYDASVNVTNAFWTFSSGLLMKELWKGTTIPMVKDSDFQYNINSNNKIIKPLKVSPTTEALNAALKQMSNDLVDFNNSWAQYNKNIDPNKGPQYYVYNNFATLVKDIQAYDNLTKDSTVKNLIIIFSVLAAFLIIVFLIWSFRHEQIIKHLKRNWKTKKIEGSHE